MQYRIKWSLWSMNANTKEEATKKVVALLKDHADDFFTLEDSSTFNPRRPLWRRLLTGS